MSKSDTTADTICHICGIRLGDRGSDICSAVHGEAAWGKPQTTAWRLCPKRNNAPCQTPHACASGCFVMASYESGRRDAFGAVLASTKMMTREMLIQWLEAEIAQS